MLPDEPPHLKDAPADQIDDVGTKIDQLLRDSRSSTEVERFYDSSGSFAGSLFLGLGQNLPYEIGVADLHAVTLLEVNPGVEAARNLLPGGERASHVSAALGRIPPGVPLWEATRQHLEWAGYLWSLLLGIEGIGKTISGKILARKRPELVPIVDGVIAKELKCAKGTYWTTLQAVLQDSGRRAELAKLQPHIPELRVLDTLMWMYWRSGGLRDRDNRHT